MGFTIGSDRRLADWPEIVEYFLLISKGSERVKTIEIGQSTEENPFIMSFISSPDNLKNLEKYKGIQAKLSDPRKVNDSELDALFSKGKTIVAVTCSIHATEVGATQMSVNLAYHLATSEDPTTRRILDNVIILLLPSLNPDGLISVKKWYESTIGKSYEGVMPPFLYNKYTGHDNNRDWFMFTQKETKLVVDHCLNNWHPQILFDLHQTRSTGMRMILPPLIDPIAPNIDPILQSQATTLGASIAADLISQGKTGIAMNVVYDSYSPNRGYQHYHNGIRLLSEVASVKIATPIELLHSQISSDRGESPLEISWNHPAPWEPGKWTLRNIVDYDFAAVMACLDHAARNRDKWLRNFYQVGQNAVSNKKSVFAFMIPEKQHDSHALWELLNVMKIGGVEIHKAKETFQAEGYPYPPGTIVILTNQPYGSFARTLLEPHQYPVERLIDGTPKTPYDVTAHCLPVKLGVNVYKSMTFFTANLEKIENLEQPKGKVTVSTRIRPKCYVLPGESNSAYRIVNKLLSSEAEVSWLKESTHLDGVNYSRGAFIVESTKKTSELLDSFSKEYGVEFTAIEQEVEGPRYALSLPRIGLYKSHIPAVEEGWTRYIFDDYKVQYKSVSDREIQGDGLNNRFDAIVLPHQHTKHMHDGHNISYYDPDFTGGLGSSGDENLKNFVKNGGTLVTWDSSSRYAMRYLELPIRNVLSGLKRSEFYAPGTLVRVLLDNTHPLTFGMPTQSAVMFHNSPAFDIRKGRVIGKFPLRNPLLSGLLIGPEKLFGRTTLATVPMGEGQVILMGFRVHFRAQMRSTYKILFNSLYVSSMSELK